LCVQAEDGIRAFHVTGVQTCALPICARRGRGPYRSGTRSPRPSRGSSAPRHPNRSREGGVSAPSQGGCATFAPTPSLRRYGGTLPVRRRSHRLAAVLAVLTATAVVAACGGSQEHSNGGNRCTVWKAGAEECGGGGLGTASAGGAQGGGRGDCG